MVARLPSGEIRTHKLLSENPEHYPDAAVEGIRVLLGLAPGQDIPSGVLHSVKMGTTVATNALLERKGEPTLLVTTAGFEDQLRIGYQNRPRLFDLHIRLPEMLYSRVIGAEERLDQGGEVLRALDQDQLRAALQDAFDAGFRAVAIAFLHGYRFPEHEQAAGEIARQIGFTQVSLSHAVSPLVKLVSRGDTTVVDAYLSPVLRRYVGQVRDALGEAMASPSGLMFMQSNGGLADAALFQGKDAILSGPAGGVVGMVRTAQQAGFDRIIGFDMGGTSTDVCHFAGDYEQSFETEVAGVRLRAPMMNIHTVAAGGGSILKFEDGRLQVGPESAGANPGPACYRRGGPLTVTDCNVLLGKVQAQYFPAVFGPSGDQPLDRDVVVEKFLALAGEIATALDEPLRSPEELAEGFLRIAVENMANAIKKISVQRGYDVTGYTLNSFGGAGGQHACQVADVLGMEQVFLQYLLHALAHRAQMHGNVGGVGNQIPACVEQGAGEVQPLLDIDRVGGVLQRRAHLVGDGHELIVEDLEHDRVDSRAYRVLPRQSLDPAQQQIATRQALRPPTRLHHGRARVFGQQCRAGNSHPFSQSRTLEHRHGL